MLKPLVDHPADIQWVISSVVLEAGVGVNNQM